LAKRLTCWEKFVPLHDIMTILNCVTLKIKTL